MTPSPSTPLSLEERLAAVSGIATPSKTQQPMQPLSSHKHAPSPTDTKLCILCGSITHPDNVKEHFITCTHLNGNPWGMHWFQSFVEAPKVESFDESYHSSEDVSAATPRKLTLPSNSPPDIEPPQPQPSTNSPNPPAPSPLTTAFTLANAAFITLKSKPKSNPKQRLKRNSPLTLAACNGITIPSRHPPGTKPLQGSILPTTPYSQNFHCNICGRGGFSGASQVRAHFPVCVGRNGNPWGVRWDDRFEGGKVEGFVDADKDMAKEKGGGGKGGEGRLFAGNPGPATEDAPMIPNIHQPVPVAPMYPIAPPPKQQQQQPQSHPQTPSHLITHPPPPVAMKNSQNPQNPHHTQAPPPLPLSTLPTTDLLTLLQQWQDFITAGFETDAMRHPSFQGVMREFQNRELVDGMWVWRVGMEEMGIGG